MLWYTDAAFDFATGLPAMVWLQQCSQQVTVDATLTGVAAAPKSAGVVCAPNGELDCSTTAVLAG